MEEKTPDAQSAIATSIRGAARPRQPGKIALACAQASRQLSRKIPYYLTPEEAHRIISASKNTRDRLFLRLLWETGVGVSEATSLRLGDVSRDGIRVLGKGRVEKVVFIQDNLVNEILLYAQDLALGRNDHLFPSRKGGHITKQRADQVIKQASHLAKLERNVHAPVSSRVRYKLSELQRTPRCASGTVGPQGHQHNTNIPPPLRSLQAFLYVPTTEDEHD